jgi:hypothetical protein
MGIIPAAALDAATTYVAGVVADALAAPLPVAIATVLAVLTVIGLRILRDQQDARRSDDGGAPWLRGWLHERSPRRAVAVAALPRLPQRVPQTRTLRPAAAPDVAADRPLRGPPGCGSRRRCEDGGAAMPR